MSRARLLKPSFFLNEELAELPYAARILFEALWCIADRAGRLEDRPKRIKHEALPYDDEDVDALLQMLHDAGFILRYAVDGNHYIQVLAFSRHQSPHIREAQSQIPEPPTFTGPHGASTVLAPDEHHASPAVSMAVSVPVPESVSVSDPMAVAAVAQAREADNPPPPPDQQLDDGAMLSERERTALVAKVANVLNCPAGEHLRAVLDEALARGVLEQTIVSDAYTLAARNRSAHPGKAITVAAFKNWLAKNVVPATTPVVATAANGQHTQEDHPHGPQHTPPTTPRRRGTGHSNSYDDSVWDRLAAEEARHDRQAADQWGKPPVRLDERRRGA